MLGTQGMNGNDFIFALWVFSAYFCMYIGTI